MEPRVEVELSSPMSSVHAAFFHCRRHLFFLEPPRPIEDAPDAESGLFIMFVSPAEEEMYEDKIVEEAPDEDNVDDAGTDETVNGGTAEGVEAGHLADTGKADVVEFTAEDHGCGNNGRDEASGDVAMAEPGVIGTGDETIDAGRDLAVCAE